jgi:HlyD family secretion protein
MEAESALEQESAVVEIDETRASQEQGLAAIPVQSLEKKLAHVEARLQRTIIRAPISGHVLKIRTRPGERIGNGPILQLGDTDEMHAVAEVYETDIPRVRVGQSATISCPALGAPLHGAVVHVGRMIYKNDVLSVDPAADADARVIEVRIRLDEPKRVAALTNLQVDVLIDVKGDE